MTSVVPATPEAIASRVDVARDGGLLEDRVWSTVGPQAHLVDARTGRAPRDGTAVRVAASATALHVRFECDDRDIWSAHARHDAPLWEEEAVEVFLAPGACDPQRYVEIEVSPAGALFDAVVRNPDGRRATMSVDSGWNASGLVARVGRPRIDRWRAELSITWGSLDVLGAATGIWRVNFFRIERVRGEDPEFSAWSPTLVDPPDFHKPARFGRLLIP